MKVVTYQAIEKMTKEEIGNLVAFFENGELAFVRNLSWIDGVELTGEVYFENELENIQEEIYLE